MKTRSATFLLSMWWLSCFIVTLGVPGYLVMERAISLDSLPDILDKISGMFAPYLGGIILYAIADRRRQPNRQVNVTAFTLAMASSCVWNLMVIGIMMQPILSLKDDGTGMSIDRALEYASTAAARISWFTGPTIGYFFGKPDKNQE